MLTLQAKEKEIENLTPDKEYVRGTVGAICQVNFDEFWQKYEKWVVFKRDGYEPIKIMADSLTSEIEIPHTILAESGEFQVGMFGVTETETLPTLYSDFIKIRYGTDTNGTTPPKYTPSEIDQLRLSKQDKLIAGQGIKIENDVIFIDGDGVQPDWNQNDPSQPDYVKNRTHYIDKQEPLTFDGNLDGHIVLDAYDGDFKLVKISDNLFTAEDLIGQTAVFTYQDGSIVEHKIDENSFGDNAQDPVMWVLTKDTMPIAYIINSSENAAADIGGNPKDIPLGTYFAYAVDNYDYYMSSLSLPEKVVKLDKKFLPDISYTKDEIDNMVGDIETLLGGI